MIPKFRAWDRYEEVMTNQEGIYFGAMDHDGMLESLILCLEERYELMQSTGLKDKNGVEIFEGDVVRSFSNINRVSDPYLTTIEPEYGYKVVIYSDGAFVLSDDGKREYSGVLNHYSGAMTKDFEVVGNIYENPDLLEEVKK